MTNKKRSLELIEDNYQTEDMGDAVSTDIAYKAIELASKPDWFHPSKGEFPKLQMHDSFLLNTGELVTYHDDTCCYSKESDIFIFWDEIEAWCYRPTYKED